MIAGTAIEYVRDLNEGIDPSARKVNQETRNEWLAIKKSGKTIVGPIGRVEPYLAGRSLRFVVDFTFEVVAEAKSKSRFRSKSAKSSSLLQIAA